MNWKKSSLHALLAVMLVSILVGGCGSPAGKRPATAAQDPAAGLWKNAAAAASPYTVDIDPMTGSWTVSGHGETWRSSPADLKTSENSDPAELNMQSPFLLSYWDGSNSQLAGPLAAKAAIKITRDGAATAVQYRFPKPIDIGITFVFHPTASGFAVELPADGIHEYGDMQLLSVQVAPFMEAAKPGEDGYLLLPDGSGALVRFNVQHPKAVGEYKFAAYGRDDALSVRRRIEPQQQAIAPVFGMVRDSKAVLGNVVEGGAQTIIHAAPAGYLSPYYRTWPEIQYRMTDGIILPSAAGESEISVVGPLDQQLHAVIAYDLLTGDQANVAGMAAAYRDYLMQWEGLHRQEESTPGFYLQMMGGVERDGPLWNEYVTLTTFAQVRSLVDELKQKGIGQLDVTMLGWEPRGGFGTSPLGLTAASALGGNDGLKLLAAYMKQSHVTFRIEKDFLQAYRSRGIPAHRYGIYGLNRDLAYHSRWNLVTNKEDGSKWPTMRADWATKAAVPGFDKYLTQEGIDGVYVRSVGNLLPSDFNRKNPLSRDQAESEYRSLLAKVGQSASHLAVDYGNGYALSLTDHIFGFPLDQSHYSGVDDTVPFFPMALHGLISYSPEEPGNLRSDSKSSFLRMVEYGAVPSYTLAVNDADLGSTRYQEIYSPLASVWVDQAVKEYKELAPLRALQGRFMLNHRALDADGKLFATDYEGGAEVIVNYGDQDATVSGKQVPAGGFAVIGLDGSGESGK